MDSLKQMRKFLINFLVRKDELVVSNFDYVTSKWREEIMYDINERLIMWRKYANIHGLNSSLVESNVMNWQSRLTAENETSKNA